VPERIDALVLRLGGPLQSWGAATRYNTRGTLTHPTKSGVVGLCAAALGLPRGADLSPLTALAFAVRVDRPGELLIDYHTMSAASHDPLNPRETRLPTADGKQLKPGESKVSRRQYLQDAVFAAAFAATTHEQRDLLIRLEHALRHPRYPLFLGRRSCPPDRPVLVERREGIGGLVELMGDLPWPIGARRRRDEPPRLPPEPLAVVVDDPAGEELLDDLPAGGGPFDRAFAQRPVHHLHLGGGEAGSREAGGGPQDTDGDDPPEDTVPEYAFDGNAHFDQLDREV
jgi:CRISPR system Cascade subunit CasD